MIRARRFPFRPTILQRYIISQFLSTFFLCLLSSCLLFLVFDFFERIKVFFGDDASLLQVLSYLFFKIPLIVQLMAPVAVLIATLLTVGRMSQQSEITAMRACGVSLFWLARPLVLMGIVFSFLMFLAGETIVPWASEKVDQIYHFDIRKKAEKGSLSRSQFWLRQQNKFFNVGFYDSRSATLHQVSIYEFSDSFLLRSRIDANRVLWKGPNIGWVMEEVIETTFDAEGSVATSRFSLLPLPIRETPADFLNHEKSPESLSFLALRSYIAKLKSEGVPVSKYLVELHAKLSFPLINVIIILVAFPFALSSARSGTLTTSFLAGVSTGFGYYFIHAFATSFGAAELIPVVPAAWAANILFASLGGFLMTGAEQP